MRHIRPSELILIVVMFIIVSASFVLVFQYGIASNQRERATISLTKEIVVYTEVIYYTSSTCGSGSQTTTTNSTVYLIPSSSGYYNGSVKTVTLTESNSTATIIQSISLCFTTSATQNTTG